MKCNIYVIILIVIVLNCFSVFAQDTTSFMFEDTTHANEYFEKAKKMAKNAKYDSSNFYSLKASDLYNKIYGQFKNDKNFIKYIKCFNLICDNYWRDGDYENAMKYARLALDLARKQFDKNHSIVIYCLNDVGIIYLETGYYDDAITYFKESYLVTTELSTKYHRQLASTCNNLGLAYFHKGDYDNALIFYNECQEIDQIYLTDNYSNEAHTFDNIGVVYNRMGDFDNALDYHKKALSIRIKLFGAIHEDISDSYVNIGELMEEMHKYEEALEYFKKALTIDLQTRGETHPKTAMTYNNIGNVFDNKGEYENAIKFLKKSLNIKLETLEKDHPLIADSYHNLAVVYENKKEFYTAIEYYQNALEKRLTSLGKEHPDVSEVLFNFGELYSKLNNIKMSLYYYQKAIITLVNDFDNSNYYCNPPLKNIKNAKYLLRTLKLKAEALKKLFNEKTQSLKDIKMSLSTYQLASQLIDTIRYNYNWEGSKLMLGERTFEIFEEAIQAVLTINKIAGNVEYKTIAFILAEKSKSEVLAQSFQESRAKKFAGIPDGLLEKENDLKIDLTFYETEIQKEKLKIEGQDSIKLMDFEDRLFNIKREYESLVEQLERSFPKYYKIKYKTETASVSDVQNALDNETALLEYFMGDSSVYVFTITNNDFDVVTIKKDSTFDKKLQSLLTSFKSVTSQSEYLTNASELYNILIKPVKQNISDKKKWIIIPDGELSLLPFEALLTKHISSEEPTDFRKLHYLINQHQISYHYSATLYLKSLASKPTESYAYDFAGFAPVFNKENNAIAANENVLFSMNSLKELWKIITRDGKNLDELKYSESEVNEISIMFPGNRRQVYVHHDASEENFKDKINNTKYVHVATHGLVHNENPKLSNLAFSQPLDSVYDGDDGFLYSGETYNLDMNADLLVLSACQTGTGKIARGEGLMALTRGFLYSGANNIIASLWKVYDEHTGKMMIELYQQILSDKSYSTALREAKLKMISDEATARPQSWASFVLIGK